MPTSQKKTALIFTRFAQASSNDFCSSLFSPALIQLTSYLHSLCLLLISAFPLDSLQQYQLLPIVRNFVCLIALVPSFDTSRLVSMAPLFDTICLCYFLSWIIIIGLGLCYSGTVRNRETLPRFSHTLAFAFLFHSRVLFLPVQYFLLMSISYANTIADKSDLFIQERIPIVITLSIFNILIAFCKEISFYRITPDKNVLACKNNLVSLITLAHKTTITFLLAFFPDSVVISRLSAVLNLIIFTILIFAIYFKLPFYQMPLNQISMTFSGISLVFSMLFVLKSFGIVQDNFTDELILYIVLVLVVIVLMQLLQNLKFKILQFEYLTVEQAVHLPILLKSAHVSSSPFPKLNKRFPRETISYLGILKLQASNLEKSQSQQKETVDETVNEYELYTLIIQHLSRLLQKNPDSVLLRVCMARIYFKKLKTGIHAIKLLKGIIQSSQSVPVKNSVETMLTNIEQSFLRSTNEEPAHLNILNYFKYRDLANELKQKIQAEVSHHTEFWSKLTQEKVDIFRMINISEGLNRKFLNIKKLWNDYSQAFGSYFGVSTMLYGVYLQTVRALPHQGWPIISNYFHHFRNKSVIRINRILSVFEGSAAVVVGSIENDKLGIVIDASSSVKSLFSIAKEKLIYQKVDILMPNFIARRHDEFILSSHKRSRLNLNANMTSIGKTIEGHFFTLELNLKAFPFLKNDVCVVAFLQKTTEEEATFVVGNGGVILDWSKKIEDYFEIDRMSLNKLKLQRFSSEFDEALSAFDICCNINIEKSKKDINEEEATTMFALGSRKDMRRFSETVINPDIFSRITRLNLNIPSQPVLDDNNFDLVQQICKKYTEGTRMSLANASLNLDQYVHEKQYFVRIEPMFIAGTLYKLVKLRDASSMAKLAASPKKNKPKIYDSFADNFPEASEKPEMTQMINKTREKRDSLQVGFYKEKTESATNNLNESDTCQIQVQHDQENLLQNKKTVNDKSSTEGPLGSGLRISKTLDEVFNNEKVRPTTRLSIVIVYFAIIAVAIMASIDYILADWSIEELRSGIVIRNIGNNRLSHSIQAWQYALLIYSVYAESELDFIKDKLYQHTIHILEQNEILKANLQDLPDQRIINIFFQRSVTLYDSVTQTVFNNEDMNGLAATDILAAENLMVAKYTSDISTFEAIKVLRDSPELMFIVNNTANDYFLVSEQELDDVETIIDSMIARNKQLLKITLSLENLSLILLIFLLVVVVKVVVASHSKAFKAIISIHPHIVQKRLNDLKAFNNHLQENIDTRKFGDNLGFYLETLDKGTRNSQTKLFRVRHSADKLVYRNLIFYLMRYLIIAVFFIICVTGIFIYSFTTAQQSFNILDIYNDKLADIQEIGHRINSILSSFCHLTLFYNHTDLPLWNEIPSDYITENLQTLTDANSVLLSSLIEEQLAPVDPVFESFLKNDICTFVVDQIDDYSKCVEATSDAPGLLSLNSKYIQQAKISIDNFLRAPTQENGQALFQSFGDETSNDIFILQKCYEFLTRRLFSQFQYEVKLQKANKLIIYIGNLVIIFIMTLLIHLAPITKFRSIDIALRRVLKIIPYEMIRNNKGCGFFLAKEFEKEIEGIKRYL